MKTCAQCGNQQQDDLLSCGRCGSAMAEMPQEGPAGETQDQSAAQAEAHSPEDTAAYIADSPKEEAASSNVPKAAYCHKCGNRIPKDGEFCAVCGTPAAKLASTEEIVPVSQPYYPPQEPYYPPKKRESQKNSKKTLVIAVCSALVVLASVSVFLAYQLNSGLGRRAAVPDEQPLVYVQDGETLKFKNSTIDKAEIITRSYDSRTKESWITSFDTHATSTDGRYLLYLNDYRREDYTTPGRGDLYIRDLTVHTGQGQATDRGTKIASEISTQFNFSADEQFVYYINGQNELYIWDFEQSYKIDSDVTGIISTTDDKILYYKGDELEYTTSYVTSFDLYVAPLSRSDRSGKVKIDSDINNLWDYTGDYEKFVYTKAARSTKEGAGQFDVYWYDVTSDKKEILITDIDGVLDADARDGTLLYLISQSASFIMEDILEDDMEEEDAQIQEPDMADYPLLDKYYNDSSYYWLYGLEEDVDFDALMEEYYAYQEAMEVYEAKQQRDKLREQISEDLSVHTDFDVRFYDLYMLQSGERKKIDGNIFQGSSAYYTRPRGDLERGYAFYLKMNANGLEKIKMSELNDSWRLFSFDLESYLTGNLNGELYFTTLEGKPARLTDSEDNLQIATYNIAVTEALDGIYFLSQEPSTSSLSSFSKAGMKLYYAPIKDGEAGEAVLVDDSAAEFNYYQTYKGSFFYLSNMKNYKCDLYLLKDGERDRLCFDVSYINSPFVVNQGETLCFFENYDNTREMGELYILNDEKIKIADDVHQYYYHSDDFIYVLRNYRAGKGDLYLYNGEDIQLIDYDVTQVLLTWPLDELEELDADAEE